MDGELLLRVGEWQLFFARGQLIPGRGVVRSPVGTVWSRGRRGQAESSALPFPRDPES